MVFPLSCYNVLLVAPFSELAFDDTLRSFCHFCRLQSHLCRFLDLLDRFQVVELLERDLDLATGRGFGRLLLIRISLHLFSRSCFCCLGFFGFDESEFEILLLMIASRVPELVPISRFPAPLEGYPSSFEDRILPEPLLEGPLSLRRAHRSRVSPSPSLKHEPFSSLPEEPQSPQWSPQVSPQGLW